MLTSICEYVPCKYDGQTLQVTRNIIRIWPPLFENDGLIRTTRLCRKLATQTNQTNRCLEQEWPLVLIRLRVDCHLSFPYGIRNSASPWPMTTAPPARCVALYQYGTTRTMVHRWNIREPSFPHQVVGGMGPLVWLIYPLFTARSS